MLNKTLLMMSMHAKHYHNANLTKHQQLKCILVQDHKHKQLNNNTLLLHNLMLIVRLQEVRIVSIKYKKL